MANEVNMSGARPARRTIVKGAAWAVPVVTVASATPAFAASPIVTVSQAGPACKLPGNSCAPTYSKGYLQPLEICNNTPAASITVTITTPAFLLINGVSTEFTPVPSSFTIPAGDCQTVILNLNLQDNSQNSSIVGTLNWTYTSSDGQTGSGTTNINTPDTPPCDNCAPPAQVQVATLQDEGTQTAEEPTDEAEVSTEEPAVESEEPAVESEEPVVETEAPADEAPEQEEQTTDTSEVTASPNS